MLCSKDSYNYYTPLFTLKPFVAVWRTRRIRGRAYNWMGWQSTSVPATAGSRVQLCFILMCTYDTMLGEQVGK